MLRPAVRTDGPEVGLRLESDPAPARRPEVPPAGALEGWDLPAVRAPDDAPGDAQPDMVRPIRIIRLGVMPVEKPLARVHIKMANALVLAWPGTVLLVRFAMKDKTLWPWVAFVGAWAIWDAVLTFRSWMYFYPDRLVAVMPFYTASILYSDITEVQAAAGNLDIVSIEGSVRLFGFGLYSSLPPWSLIRAVRLVLRYAPHAQADGDARRIVDGKMTGGEWSNGLLTLIILVLWGGLWYAAIVGK